METGVGQGEFALMTGHLKNKKRGDEWSDFQTLGSMSIFSLQIV
jgi:hypothetical protein